ncbi:MAG: peptide MFS transporter [Saprospiraceae bacterium]|nr:peptide MFS transporter [Saprospiraceae bacterium]
MNSNASTEQFFENKVIGHPAGLFVLFFTEMWERFSYYGMRAILVLFLTSSLMKGGWAWPRESALALYGTYTAMVYLTPILGGMIADKIIGYRNAVVLGAGLMALGHACMAFETPMFLYIGLSFLIFGNGFFKPNMTSILSHMYKNHPEKKDGAYTIFYMGVNAGAFLGIMLCGYLGEKVGWSWGFGLAGIFMFLGMIQFYLAQNIFGEIGKKPQASDSSAANIAESATEENGGKLNPFTTVDKILIGIAGTIALVWVINDPMSKVYGYNIFGGETMAGYSILFAFFIFLVILFTRIVRYIPKTRDRMIAVFILAIFYMFFWACFEQAGGSMTIFADDYTQRALVGNSALMFKISNTLLTVIPMGILTYVLYSLFVQTFKKYGASNLVLGSSFLIIWCIVIWMLYKEFQKPETEIAASWFSILNSFFIISFGPIFSKIWESKYNPSGTLKYAIGLILLGTGFLALAYGSTGIPMGAKTASVSIVWLILAYLFHTLGELCISPVGLSYVSKLVPGRMIGIMFGIWYLAVAVGNKLAGTMGGKIDQISNDYGLTTFFLLFTFIPFVGAVVIFLLGPLMRKLMHGYT